MNAGRRPLAGLCLIGAICCASCVPCDHPLTDEKTSVADEVLIGDWLGRPAKDEPPFHVSIGRKSDAENVLEWVASSVDQEQHVTIERHDFFTTRVRSLRLVTYENDRPGDDEPRTYSIWLLESPDEDTVKVYMMDACAFAKGIEARQLRGDVKRRWLFGWYAEATRINSAPAELREYLAQAGRSCFILDSPVWTLTRVPQTK